MKTFLNGREWHEFFKNFFRFISLILLLDFFGFVIWCMSGQLPADGFYLGMITANIIKLFLF